MAPSSRPVSQTGMSGFMLQWALSLDWETMTGRLDLAAALIGRRSQSGPSPHVIAVHRVPCKARYGIVSSCLPL